MKAFETVFFDIDDTLLDFSQTEYHALKKLFGRIGLPFSDAALAIYHESNQRLWNEFEQQKVTLDDITRTRFSRMLNGLRQAGVSTYIADVLKASEIEALYQSYLSEGVFPIDGAVEVLTRLRPICQLYVVTNGLAVVQRGRLARWIIERNGSRVAADKFFDGIVISQEIGVNKPKAEFFDHAVALSAMPRDKILVVGDSLTSDMGGGKAAGLKTCLFAPQYTTEQRRATIASGKADYVIRDLRDVLEIVQ